MAHYEDTRWKVFKGMIEVSIEAKTKEEANKRLSEIAKQIISENKDVYKTTPLTEEKKVTLKDLEFADGENVVKFLSCIAKDDKNPLQAEAKLLLAELTRVWIENTNKNMPPIDYSDQRFDE